jgi:hypothetical protein
MSSHKWRMFYVVFDLMSDKALSYKVQDEGEKKITVFDKVAVVMKSILVGNHDAKNFNVKSIVLNNMMKPLLTKMLPMKSQNVTQTVLHTLL